MLSLGSIASASVPAVGPPNVRTMRTRTRETGFVARLETNVRRSDPLPRGRRLVTLQDAGNFITKLPKAEHSAPEWQAAMEALILVATLGGPTLFARIGVMRVLSRHVKRVFSSSRKDPHWGRRKLARDQ
jgi:hypothetical protein